MNKVVVHLAGKMPEGEDEFLPIRSRNKKMRAKEEQGIRVAQKNAPIVLYGETGTGKDVMAQSIHENSSRSNKRFIAVNCAAIPDTLIESELFGHEKHSFTGAQMKRGLLELADGGTLFLDEIADMSLAVQAKLLRAIEGQPFRRVGGTNDISVNVRVIAATNKNLLQEIQRGTFRQDLYHRIAAVRITLPPLRERMEDLLSFVNHFLAKLSRRDGKNYMINESALEALKQYHWPGNIRELERMLDGVTALYDGETILPEHLSFEESPSLPNQTSTEDDVNNGVGQAHIKDGKLKLTIDRVRLALEKTNWNKCEAAKLLDCAVRTVFRWIHKYHLKPFENPREQFPEALSP